MFLVPDCIDDPDNQKQRIRYNVLIIKLSSRWCVKVNFVKKNKNRECPNLLFLKAFRLLISMISLSVHLNFVPLTLERAS